MRIATATSQYSSQFLFGSWGVLDVILHNLSICVQFVVKCAVIMTSSPSKDCQGTFTELKKLIGTLTHTGEKVLDPPVLKGITRICK